MIMVVFVAEGIEHLEVVDWASELKFLSVILTSTLEGEVIALASNVVFSNRQVEVEVFLFS